MTALLGVNDRNIAVGFYVDTAGATHGYIYDIAANAFSANIDDPNGVGATTAAAINDHDQIVGFYTDGNGVTHGFFESRGIFKTIDGANATATSRLGLTGASRRDAQAVSSSGRSATRFAGGPRKAQASHSSCRESALAALQRSWTQKTTLY